MHGELAPQTRGFLKKSGDVLGPGQYHLRGSTVASKNRMLIIDPPATAGGTDPVQVAIRQFPAAA